MFPDPAQTKDASLPRALAGTQDQSRDEEGTVNPSATVRHEEDGSKELPRVFVSEERMWLAICGHLPDPSKVVPLEFVLLSIIASTREKGILQIDLANASGQDKRSVPNRTDRLHARGYIEKRRIQVRGALTSLLILRMFAEAPEARALTGVAGETSTRTGMPRETSFVDFGPLLHSLFDHLRKEKIITHKSLRIRLDMNTKWLRRIFSRTISKLEESGCVKRVRAASKDSVNLKWFYPSIKYIREPTEDDLTRYLSFGTTIDSMAEDSSMILAGNDDEDDEDEVEAVRTHRRESNNLSEPLVELERPCSQWNPDRLFNNTIVDAVNGSSDEGSSILVRIPSALLQLSLSFVAAHSVRYSWAIFSSARGTHS